MTELKKYETVVVGGGIAGLTAAAYLAKAGKKVLLIEKNKECGGLVNTFSHNGFRFESGVRALLDAGIIFPMLKELDISLEVVRSKVSVGIAEHIIDIEDLSSLEDYKNLLVQTFPDSEEDILEVLKDIRKIMKDMDVLYGIENPNFKNLTSDWKFLFTKLLPWFPGFLITMRKIYKKSMPVESYLDEMISNRSLRDMISQHFFKNTPTFFALSYFSLYLDYFYPEGGVGRLAEAVEDKFLTLGGTIVRGKTVSEVDAHQKVVKDEDGQFYAWDKLIWAADLKTFYRISNAEGLSNKQNQRFSETKDQILQHRGGDAVYTLYLETDLSPEYFKKISHGHFFYTPSSQGLGETHWSELDDLLQHIENENKEEVLKWVDKFIALNTFEISIPVLKAMSNGSDEKTSENADKEAKIQMAPDGKTGLIVSVLAEYDLFEKVEAAGWYDEFIQHMENKIIEALTATVYPELSKNISHHFSFTPLSYQRRVGASEGAVTGWSFQDTIPVANKMLEANKAVLTPLPDVYQAGQWTYSPGGVPMSILTGKLAAQKVLK